MNRNLMPERDRLRAQCIIMRAQRSSVAPNNAGMVGGHKEPISVATRSFRKLRDLRDALIKACR